MVDNSYGAIGSLRHVGFIVKDGDASVNMFKTLLNLKDEDTRIINVPDTITLAFVSLGSIELEFIQPISDDVKEALGNPPEGINHIAFNVTDIEESLQTLKEKGFHPGHITPEGAVSMGDKMIAYLNTTDTEGILIELVESL
jgi:catechol 2,3-dioxygenase-like lactoylglutathione lyase family enzyme